MIKLSINEIEEESQAVYDNAKAILGLKRRHIQKEINNDYGGGSVESDFFRFYIDVQQSRKDPKIAVFKRTLIVRKPLNELPQNFQDIFPVQPNEIIVPIEGTIDFDELVEKFENLEDAIGGTLTEDDSKGLITYTTTEGLKMEIFTEEGELLIKPNYSMNLSQLIARTAKGLETLTGQDLKFLSFDNKQNP